MFFFASGLKLVVFFLRSFIFLPFEFKYERCAFDVASCGYGTVLLFDHPLDLV